jgi:PilZ domain
MLVAILLDTGDVKQTNVPVSDTGREHARISGRQGQANAPIDYLTAQSDTIVRNRLLVPGAQEEYDSPRMSPPLQRGTGHMEKRKHVRVSVEYALSLLGERVRGEGIVQDLSVAGCRAHMSANITPGDSVGLLIDVPRYDNPLHVDVAIVRWAKEQEFGMEFLRVPTDSQQRIQDVIRSKEASGPV